MKKIIGFGCFLLVLSLTIGASVASAANNAKERQPIQQPYSQSTDSTPDDTQATTSKMTFTYNDPKLGPLARSAWVHLPPNYLHRGAMPLVLNFHGGFSNAGAQMFYSGMNTLADEKGFVVAYPEGIDRSWNAVIPSPAAQRDVDDVGFALQVFAQIHGKYPIDNTRVYATGISNGAQMAYTLAQRAQGIIAAVGLVSGGLGINQQTTEAVPTIIFHGTADSRIPYNGSVGNGAVTFNYQPMETGIIPLMLKGMADFKPIFNYQPYAGFTSTNDIKIRAWQNSNNRTDLVLVKIIGGGHTWPDGRPLTTGDPLGLGVVTHGISANRAMWDFFQAHNINYVPSNHPTGVSEVGFTDASPFAKGSTHTITWHSTNLGKKVVILWAKKNIVKGTWKSVTGFISPKNQGAPNVGTYDWTIPTGAVDIYPVTPGVTNPTPTQGVLPDGNDYIVQVFAADDNGNAQNMIGTSPTFTIGGRQLVHSDPINNQSAVISSFSGNLKTWFQKILSR